MGGAPQHVNVLAPARIPGGESGRRLEHRTQSGAGDRAGLLLDSTHRVAQRDGAEADEDRWITVGEEARQVLRRPPGGGPGHPEVSCDDHVLLPVRGGRHELP